MGNVHTYPSIRLLPLKFGVKAYELKVVPRYTHEDFVEFCTENPGLRLEQDKNGNIFIIERLKDAISLGKNEIKVHFLIRKIKKNGEPYQYANEAWGIDYFSLEKVVE